MAKFSTSPKANGIKVKRPLKRHIRANKYLIIVAINILLIGFLIFNK